MTSNEVAEVEKAVEVENDQLRDYELVLIINPDAGEEAIEAILDSLNKYITGNEGTVSNTERWGKKKLAYPIRRFLEGHYVLMQFRMNPASGRQLEVNLKISEDVMRHLLINLNAD